MPDPITNDNQNQTTLPQSFPEMTDIPSIPTTPQDVSTTTTTTTTTDVNTIPDDINQTQQPIDVPPIITDQKPKKKKGGVIATILGIFLLIGAVGAGVVLVGQKQLFKQKAGSYSAICASKGSTTCLYYDCSQKIDCTSGTLVSGFCNNGYTCPGPCPASTSGCSTQCEPGTKEDNTCTREVNGNTCEGTKERTCNSSGYWGEYSGCMLPAAVPGDPCSVSSATAIPQAPDCPADALYCAIDLAYNTTGAIFCYSSSLAKNVYCCPASKPRLVANACKTLAEDGLDPCSDIIKTSTSIGCPNDPYNNGECWVTHFWCPNMTRDTAHGGCNEQTLAIKVKSASFSKDCGVEQIDVYYPACTDLSKKFISKVDDPPCGTTPPSSNNPTPTPPPGDWAKCWSIKAYDTEWKLLTDIDLSKLQSGDKVIFTVAGGPPDKIDKAKFTIEKQPSGETNAIGFSGEIIDKKPGTNEFYYEYTIPEGFTSFTVKAEVHHVTLGWF